MDHHSRPDLTAGVWSELEPIKAFYEASATQLILANLTSPHHISGKSDAPSKLLQMVICTYLQEIMEAPHVAADGFTYEANAIQGWLSSGHNTSPMTNLPLPNDHLIPNRALRSAIQDWKQNHRS
ncbi:hypothetical protein SAY87_012784 [Trapa incisa]|uniref:RING-type E3 ubiquitin transferase n=1 Tax=Trapa incisa TaxID=236973 RepID=A0AAN7H1I5_9MYRT|nr:hypothetical protein SAY87_012784 [Trapa incisa]